MRPSRPRSAAQDVLQDAVREVKDAAKEVTAHAVHEVKDAAQDVTTGAKDAAWDATVGRAEEAVSSAGETAKGVSSIVIDTIKQNPIPAALAGLSLFWLYKHRAGRHVVHRQRVVHEYGTGTRRICRHAHTPGISDSHRLRVPSGARRHDRSRRTGPAREIAVHLQIPSRTASLTEA